MISAVVAQLVVVPGQVKASGEVPELEGGAVYSVEHHLPAYLRSRAISRIKLASLTMVQGDPLEAVTIGNLALDDAGPVRSLRAADDLRELHRMVGPHGKLPEVVELRTRIRETVGAVA